MRPWCSLADVWWQEHLGPRAHWWRTAFLHIALMLVTNALHALVGFAELKPHQMWGRGWEIGLIHGQRYIELGNFLVLVVKL